MEQTVSQIEVDLGPIDTMIYNAGNGIFKNYDNTTEQEFDTCIGTNAKGLLIAAQLICPKMIKNGGGTVAITGSTASVRGKQIAIHSFYCTIFNFMAYTVYLVSA